MFKTIEINGVTLVKTGILWCKEGGDGEMYPIADQYEAQCLYDEQQAQTAKV